VDYRVISIGTLASHPLWGEGSRAEVRTGHATTTLVSAEDASILVDPSLPSQALLARLGERASVQPEQITHVFLTSADPLHRRGLVEFTNATWLASEPELDATKGTLAVQIKKAGDGTDEELLSILQREQAILTRCEPAQDSIVPGVDLFPLPGVTPGSCGLLLPLPRATVLICGDAVATAEHVAQGKVLPDCFDVEQARQSFAEAVEIADLLILGRDNITLNPLRRPFGM
jgi:glyoxylase-like metal-dependent hydrolase (beta-lactamase superfamily II)